MIARPLFANGGNAAHVAAPLAGVPPIDAMIRGHRP
jgi:hypothetical protein